MLQPSILIHLIFYISIFFNFNNTQLTKIDTSGLSVFHAAREAILPYNYEGWYNVEDRLNK